MSHAKQEVTPGSSVHSLEKGHDDSDSASILAKYDTADIERAWRKVDWHIMPIAVLLYLASYIDRYVISIPPSRIRKDVADYAIIQCQHRECQSSWNGFCLGSHIKSIQLGPFYLLRRLCHLRDPFKYHSKENKPKILHSCYGCK